MAYAAVTAFVRPALHENVTRTGTAADAPVRAEPRAWRPTRPDTQKYERIARSSQPGIGLALSKSMAISRHERVRRRRYEGVLLACAAAFASACGSSESATQNPPLTTEPTIAPAPWNFAYFYANAANVYGVSANARSSKPVVLGDATSTVGAIAFDESDLYYGTVASAGGNWTIQAVPTDGSSSPVPLVTNVIGLDSLALDDTWLYVLGNASTPTPSGAESFSTFLIRVPRNAGSFDASTLETLVTEPQTGSSNLKLFGGDLYFSDALDESLAGNAEPAVRVRRVSAAGGTPETVTEAQNVLDFAVDESGLYHFDAGFTVDCGLENPMIEWLPSDGSATQRVGADLPVVGPLAVHDGVLYFATQQTGCVGMGGDPYANLRKFTSPNGTVETVVSNVSAPGDFYFSGQSLYFTHYRNSAEVASVTPL